MADSKSISQKSVPSSYQQNQPHTAPTQDVSLNLLYFKTGPGLIKIVQIVLGIIIMACTAPAWTSGTHWFLFVVVTAFIATLLWSFIHLLSLQNSIRLPIDWLLTELLNTGFTTFLYMIAVIVQFCDLPPNEYFGRNVAGGVFGIFNMMAYVAGTFFLFRDWHDHHPNSSIMNGMKRNPNSVV